MYRVIDTLHINGFRVHILRAEVGYYGWGWELPDVFCADMRPETCVGYDSPVEVLEAVYERVGEVAA